MKKIAVLLLICGPLLHGCGVGEASISATDGAEAANESALPVEVTTPHRGDIYATYRATASISSDADAPVTARVAGELVDLLVEEGEHVEQGQVLAKLDGERLRLEMLAAKADLDRARREFQRNQDLHKRGLVSAAMFDGVRFELDALQAKFDLARLNYGYTKVRAPISGIVSAREVKPGQHLSSGEVAFSHYRHHGIDRLPADSSIRVAEIFARSPCDRRGRVDARTSHRCTHCPQSVRPSTWKTARFRATALIDNAGRRAGTRYVLANSPWPTKSTTMRF